MSWPKIVDFEGGTNPYTGAATDPSVVGSGGDKKGQNGSTYALDNEGVKTRSWYLKNSDYNWISDVKAISFWHKPKTQVSTSNGYIPQILYIHDDTGNTPNWSSGLYSYYGMWNPGGDSKYYIQNSSAKLFSKWYVDGVEVVESGVPFNEPVIGE